MVSLSLMTIYIKHLRYLAKANHFGPFYYIQIDPQDYDEWHIETPEEEIHFQTPSKLGSPARSLPKSGSPHLSTPNKCPSPLPHKPTPQQTAKSQQVHTHQSDDSTTDTIKIETPLLTVYWRWSIDLLTHLMMMLQTSAMSFQLRCLIRIKSVNAGFYSMPITPINNW